MGSVRDRRLRRRWRAADLRCSPRLWRRRRPDSRVVEPSNFVPGALWDELLHLLNRGMDRKTRTPYMTVLC